MKIRISPLGWMPLAAAWLLGCGEQAGPEPEVSGSPYADLAEQAALARRNFSHFYLPTFAAMIESGNYDRDMPIMRYDHYAHRLWVPDRDASYDLALDTLASRVRVIEIEERGGGATSEVRRAAYFADEDQLHRDQYAMIFSEMGIGSIGPAVLADFVSAASADYGAFGLTQRGDNPWSAALLARHHGPEQSWLTAGGTSLTAGAVVQEMIDAPFFPESRDKFACYDYHAVYGLAAALAAGHETFAPEAKARMIEAISAGAEVCAASFERGNDMSEIIGRVKLNGHLIEAFFRAPHAFLPISEFERDLGEIIDGLARDSELLQDLPVYEGPPDIFIAVPHAIHGLDLALRRLADLQ